MKSNPIFFQKFLIFNLRPQRLQAAYYKFSFVLILCLATLSPWQVKAQNYIVNYYGFKLDARDLVYYPGQKQFLINTMHDGQLGYINSEGQYRLLLKDSLLIGSTGVKIRGNTLYALTNPVNGSSAAANGNRPRLVKLNLSTKKVESVYELEKLYKGPHFVTDLTIDPEGVVYIADASSPVIYKIDAKGVGSVLVENDMLASKTGQVKSIAYHKHEYLLVAVDRDILKIDLKTNAVSTVFVETGFESINSLHFTRNYLLIVSEGGRSGKVHILNTSNSWVAGNVLRTDTWKYKSPVNIEFVDNRIYVLDSDKVASSDFSVRVIDLNKLPTNKRKKARVIAGDVTILKKDF